MEDEAVGPDDPEILLGGAGVLRRLGRTRESYDPFGFIVDFYVFTHT